MDQLTPSNVVLGKLVVADLVRDVYAAYIGCYVPTFGELCPIYRAEAVHEEIAHSQLWSAICGSRGFIVVFTKARYSILSLATLTQTPHGFIVCCPFRDLLTD
jgi:hypothetical protein